MLTTALDNLKLSITGLSVCFLGVAYPTSRTIFTAVSILCESGLLCAPFVANDTLSRVDGVALGPGTSWGHPVSSTLSYTPFFRCEEGGSDPLDPVSFVLLTVQLTQNSFPCI